MNTNTSSPPSFFHLYRGGYELLHIAATEADAVRIARDLIGQGRANRIDISEIWDVTDVDFGGVRVGCVRRTAEGPVIFDF